MGPEAVFPPLPLKDWQDTKTTLHLFAQIVGKIRLTLSPKLNHWWHVPFYLSARGLTTSAIPYRERSVDMEFDLVDHHLAIRTSDGATEQIALGGHSVARFHKELLSKLDGLGIQVDILASPFDPSKVGSDTPFGSDEAHATYDPDYAHRFWRILVPIDGIFKTFRSRFLGKCSPVHLFWHSFDLAATRFSGRRAPVQDGADPVTKEAYSHEVISAGFWVGDDNTPEPAFYTYVHPEPPGLGDEPLRPNGAWWQKTNGTHMALYRYEDLRSADDPRTALLEFLQSAYQAGASLAQWPREELEMKE
jgi:hypothetical protein